MTWWDETHFNLSAFARHIGLTEAADHRRGVVAYVEPGPAGATRDSGPAPVEGASRIARSREENRGLRCSEEPVG